MTSTDETRANTAEHPRRRPNRYVVGKVSDFPESGRTLVEVNGREIGIFLVDGVFHAVMNRCPHLGGPLCYGQIVSPVSATVPGPIQMDHSKKFLTCPWHNWEFDLVTGQSYWDPNNLHARPFPIDVEGGGEIVDAIESGSTDLIKGPYRAEKVDIVVEDDYVVLSLKSPKRRASTDTTTTSTGDEQR